MTLKRCVSSFASDPCMCANITNLSLVKLINDQTHSSSHSSLATLRRAYLLRDGFIYLPIHPKAGLSFPGLSDGGPFVSHTFKEDLLGFLARTKTPPPRTLQNAMPYRPYGGPRGGRCCLLNEIPPWVPLKLSSPFSCGRS